MLTAPSISAAAALRSGKTVVDVSGLNDSSQSVAILANGGLRLIGLTSDGDRQDYAKVTLTASGQRDYSYSQDGIDRLPAVTPIADSAGLTAGATGAMLASRILYDNGGYYLSVLAISDTLHQRPAELLSVRLAAQDPPPAYSSVQALADGTLLAGARSDTSLTLTRFDEQGRLDVTFGNDGLATLALPEGVRFDSQTPLTLQADGKILLAGYSYTGADTDFSITRYNPDGSLDREFGDAGTVTVDVAGGSDMARAVLQQTDGTLLVAGSSDSGDGNVDFGLARLDANGSLDTAFAGGGRATFDFAGGRDAAQSITVLDDGRILLTGAAYTREGNADFAALQLNADGRLDTSFGDRAGAVQFFDGQASDDLIVGTGTDEVINGLSGRDLIDGGAGRDLLSGGALGDVFRFSSREDSYRTGSESFSDHILDLDPLREVLDLTRLGFSGVGNGYDNTLAVRVDTEANRTYLKSFEPDANGHRFEVVLDGMATERLNLYFEPTVLEDGSYSDQLLAGNVAGELRGNKGDDRLYGRFADDVLDGGLGQDRLFGSAGADTYRFTTLRDSYRNASETFTDRIVGFDVFEDTIDVSALGLTGLGDGHDGTLAVVVNDAGTVTYLKDYDANSRGERFELTFRGDLSQTLSSAAFAFAEPDSTAAPVELLGVAGAVEGGGQA